MQFRLTTLFGCVSASAVYFAIVFAVPATASYICLLLATLTMFPVIVVGVVYDRGYARTFWIGCAASGMIPLLTMIYLSLGGSYILLIGESGEGEARTIPVIWAVSHGLVFLSGGVAVATRRLIERKNRQRQPDTTFDGSILHGRVTVAGLRLSGHENE